MQKKIATDIETGKWHSIIHSLKLEGWTVAQEYDLFDKGIDFDLYELVKDGEKIDFVWDNWTEGDIICSESIAQIIEKRFTVNFQ